MTLDELRPFSRYAYYKAEAHRINRELMKLQLPNSPNKTHFSVKVDKQFLVQGGCSGVDKLIDFFGAEGFYICNNKDGDMVAEIKAEYRGKNLLAHVSRVHPVRVRKIHIKRERR